MRIHAGLRAMARAVDAKDAGTGEHSERVAKLVRRLARCADWPAVDADRLCLAGLVHDVGKLAIPHMILTKPSRLTEREMSIVMFHVELGVEILMHGNSDVLDHEQFGWIAQHHERPDGRGYPAGLGREQLSRGGQLLALADSWDVMTTERPYKAAKETAVALREVQDACGTQFTHYAVGALERMLA